MHVSKPGAWAARSCSFGYGGYRGRCAELSAFLDSSTCRRFMTKKWRCSQATGEFLLEGARERLVLRVLMQDALVRVVPLCAARWHQAQGTGAIGVMNKWHAIDILYGTPPLTATILRLSTSAAVSVQGRIFTSPQPSVRSP
uniref:Uncharacterized protein n=1 Tax=Ixodes ricinus TaxID=34613 RepID=A0A6B0UTN2_IXORI